MTVSKQNISKDSFISAKIDRIMLPVSILLLIILFIINASRTAVAIQSSLSVCITSVIPSIFPCMVLSRLLISCGGGELIGRVLGRPLGKLFGISRSSVAAFLLGTICGFPIGAVVASTLYKRNEISKSEFERLIGFTSLPSPAFVINAVGGSMLKNRNAGLFLFLLLLFSSSLIGIVGKRKNNSPTDLSFTNNRDDLSLAQNTVTAVASSASALLTVCAYSVFFSALCAVINDVLNLSAVFSALVSGFFEFSGGCAAAASLGGRLALPFVALILGWSGLGVHFQIMSVCGEISFKKYFLSTFFRGIICFVIAFSVNSIFFDI